MSLLILVVALSVLGAPVLAQLDEAPFEWDHKFASPGTSLSVEILEMISGPPDGEVKFSIKPSGFSGPAANLTVWWQLGDEFYQWKPKILADGTFEVWTEKYIRGQSFDIALGTKQLIAAIQA